MPFIREKAFTLIELLVVVSIIGLLASIVVVALGGSRSEARDAKRIADLKQIRNALELYFNKYGYYPPSYCGVGSDGYNCNGYRYSMAGGNWIPGLEEFITIPVDPINNASQPWEKTVNNYSYAYGNVGKRPPGYPSFPNAGNTYDLTARLETIDHPQSCNRICYKYYFSENGWCGTGVACGGVGDDYSPQIYEASPSAAGN